MSKLIYLALTSLDGFIEDDQGSFDWAMPDAEVHHFVNGMSRTVGTELYGRRMYETMAVWETIGDQPDVSAEEAAFAEDWRASDKVVYSRTLDSVAANRASRGGSTSNSNWSMNIVSVTVSSTPITV